MSLSLAQRLGSLSLTHTHKHTTNITNTPIHTERARELLLLLRVDEERQEAQRRLGLCGQTFSISNPTGYYNLNMTLQADRDVAVRLRGIKIDQVLKYHPTSVSA